MTVERLLTIDGFQKVALPRPDREISGGYCGDLLSWVMGRACADSAWITIMSNVNVIAVATLADISCVIFAEGVIPDAELVSLAERKEINLVSTELSTYECAVALGKLLK